MSKRQIEMLDIKHLLRLKQKGRSNRKIGETLGIHRNTVNGLHQTVQGNRQGLPRT